MTKQQQWDKARKKLKKIYEEKGIFVCELRLKDCWYNSALSFAHRKTRQHYLEDPELLGEFNETLLACCNCHEKIEKSPLLTDLFFNKLRQC